MNTIAAISGEGTMSAEMDREHDGKVVPLGLETISSHDTYWGYVIRQDSRSLMGAAAVEIGALAMGCVFLLGAVGHWLIEPRQELFASMPLKLAMTTVFLAAGGILYRYGKRGLAPELVSDLSRRELRMVYRNRQGLSHVVERIPFARVDSLFIRRCGQKNGCSRLFARIAEGDREVELLNAPVNDLETVMRRLTYDMRQRPIVPSRPGAAAPRRVVVNLHQV